MHPLAALASTPASRYVSAASGKGAPATAEEAQPVASGDEVAVSEKAAGSDKPSKGLLGRLGKLGAVVALAGVLTATTGCAVHSGYHWDPYGNVHSQTTGVGPDGTIYTQRQRSGPYGTTTQTDQIGPGGVHRNTQHVGPGGVYNRNEGVGPGGYYRYDTYGNPIWVPGPVYPQRGPICRPMTWWDPGGCY